MYLLFQVGLLSLQLSMRNYAILRKRFNLTLEDVNEQVLVVLGVVQYGL